MKTKIYFLALYLILQSVGLAYGAYLTNVPQTITQPNGQVINCFGSGDEYFNWLHDANNYTIVQNSTTGYYCYAIVSNNQLVASQYIVGVSNPALVGLSAGNNELINIIWSQPSTQQQAPAILNNTTQTLRNTGTINNIVVYLNFSDSTGFGVYQSFFSSLFNSNTVGINSMYNYFKEISYNNLNILSSFYPINNGTNILSYKDSHNRNYYCPYNANTNPNGYVDSNSAKYRERNLIKSASLYIQNQIPLNLNLDFDNNQFVDNMIFIIQGGPSFGNSILIPHKDVLDNNGGGDNIVYFNSKRVWSYNMVFSNEIIDSNSTSVLCHEFLHSLGLPDLYHKTSPGIPIGTWDILAAIINPPQSTCMYNKYCVGWITTIPEINQSGHYILNAIGNPQNNCYKILSPNSNEFFVLEFRQKTGTFENLIPATGLIIYRINKTVYGNYNGPPDGIYIYRPNNIDYYLKYANFDLNLGRGTFSNTSNPNCLLSDGTLANIYIKNINVSGNQVSFDVRFCDNADILYSNTNQLPPVTNASNTIQTSGSVIVKPTDNVIFEAGQEIQLNAGFEVQAGGQLEINMNDCGNH